MKSHKERDSFIELRQALAIFQNKREDTKNRFNEIKAQDGTLLYTDTTSIIWRKKDGTIVDEKF